jgi:hypothetical protein
MKMKRMSSFVCAVAFLGSATMAMAGAYGEPEQAEEMPRSAPAAAEVAPSDEFSPFAYGAVGALYSEEFFDGSAQQLRNSYGWGISARAGYRFHPNIAAELLYEHVIEFDADQGTDRSAWTVGPNMKIFLLEGFCEPYVSLGGSLMGSDNERGIHKTVGKVGDGLGFATRYAIGADFYATEQIFIEAELAYVLPVTSGVANYDHMNVGLSIGYAFN